MAALRLLASISPSFVRLRASSVRAPTTTSVRCLNSVSDVHVRRSGNYQPTLWDDAFIQSVTADYSLQESSYIGRVKELKQKVKTMLGEVVDPSRQLELVDDLERVGLSYHFDHEIDTILTTIFKNNIDHSKYWEEKGLSASALAFRILRQHGHNMPQVQVSSQVSWMKMLENSRNGSALCLYEASYLSVEGETILEKARDFATKHLQENVKKQNRDDQEIINHALELPLHWRMARLESRRFIDIYEKRHDKINTLLELAKLDFNMVQAIHQDDLKQGSRWWRSTCIGEKLTFTRNRLVENFLWTVGESYESQFGYSRRMMTKVNSLITTIDDVYDVYGSLDELNLFTNAVKRWDLEAMDTLPYYMKICFFTLYNSTNEMAFDAMNNHGINIISYLKNAICARNIWWRQSGTTVATYTPSLQEYLDNAWISISAPLILVHAYFFVTDQLSDEAMSCLESGRYCDIIRWSALILRLADDLGTSSEELQRGDVPKSIQCYMHESGASEEEARDHIRHLISETWNKMNKERGSSNNIFCEDFERVAMNLARTAQCMYQFEDGHASQGQVTKDRISSLIIQPIT